jgi:transcriptional regulator with XRE-family HTH domain
MSSINGVMMGSNTDERERIANVMKVGRKLRGLSQSEMAEALNISQGKVSKLESGILAPDAGCWYTFCQQLKVNPDFTYNTGYIFTSTRERGLKGVFKLGKLKKRALIKIKECIPFVMTIKELGRYEDFLKHTRKLKIDADVFYVPDYSVPIDILRMIFNFLSENISERNFLLLTSKHYVNKLEVLAPGAESSLAKLTKHLNKLDNVIHIEESRNALKIALDQNFEYSSEDNEFLSTFINYKSMQLKQICKHTFSFKNIKVEHLSPFEIELRYTA